MSRLPRKSKTKRVRQALTDVGSTDKAGFITPEILRKLAAGAQLRVEAVHLAANDRDMLAVLTRPARISPSSSSG